MHCANYLYIFLTFISVLFFTWLIFLFFEEKNSKVLMSNFLPKKTLPTTIVQGTLNPTSCMSPDNLCRSAWIQYSGGGLDPLLQTYAPHYSLQFGCNWRSSFFMVHIPYVGNTLRNSVMSLAWTLFLELQI
jgi:hypothetical protein